MQDVLKYEYPKYEPKISDPASAIAEDVARSIREGSPYKLKPVSIDYVKTYFEFVESSPKPSMQEIEFLQEQLYGEKRPALSEVYQKYRAARHGVLIARKQPSALQKGIARFVESQRKYIYGGAGAEAVIVPAEITKSIIQELRVPELPKFPTAEFGPLAEVGKYLEAERLRPLLCYYWRGSSERYLWAQRAVGAQRGMLIQGPSIVQVERQLQFERALEREVAVQRNVISQANIQVERQMNVQRQFNVQVERQVQTQLQQQLQVQLQVQMQHVATMENVLLEQTTTTTKPPWALIFERPSMVQPSRMLGYHALVRERGKKVKGRFVPGRFVQVNDEPLSMKGAVGLGSLAADETVARSFKVVPAKRPGKPGYEQYYYMLAHKFRRAKRARHFVERTKYAIDTSGEFAGITVKGWKARRRRMMAFAL
jgi:hypothetical protein